MSKKALIVIDVQIGLFQKRNNIFNQDELLNNINHLIKNFRENEQTVVFFQHQNKQLSEGSEEWEIHSDLILREIDPVFQKTTSNCFDNKEFMKFLTQNDINELFCTGLVSHGCVKAACVSGKNLGYNMTLIADAHSNWNDDAGNLITKVNNEMQKAGITVLNSQEIIS